MGGREPLGDESGVQYAILVRTALANHSIAVLHLGAFDVVDRFAAMLLTHPFRRAVVLDRLLDTLVIADGQRRFIRIAPNEVPSQRASFVAFALAGAS
jgi:hypothetical protein